MLNTHIDISQLKDIYMVSNTPSYLMKEFSRNDSVIGLVSNFDTKTLINEFIRISTSQLESIDDLVYAYALYIAILLKNDDATSSFIANEGNINYEWFEDLRKSYKEKFVSTSFLEVNDINLPKERHRAKNESHNSVNAIELEFT